MMLVGWGLLAWQFIPTQWYQGLHPATIASVGGLFYVLCFRSNRLTAIAGKVAIFVSLLQLFIVYIQAMTIAVGVSELWLVYAIISGLVLERVSPYQQFYMWMFLGIAGKVQFGLVSATLTQFSEHGGLVSDYVWWLSVAVLFLFVPIAAGAYRYAYRGVVLLGTGVSGVLLVDVWYRAAELSFLVLFLALVTIIWPLVIDRWVGRQVFLP